MLQGWSALLICWLVEMIVLSNEPQVCCKSACLVLLKARTDCVVNSPACLKVPKASCCTWPAIPDIELLLICGCCMWPGHVAASVTTSLVCSHSELLMLVALMCCLICFEG